MLQLDVKTLILIFTLLAFLSFLVIAWLWRQNRNNFRGMGFWTADYLLQMLALLMIFLRGSIPDPVSLFLPNTLAVTGLLLLLMGLMHFTGRHYNQIPNYLVFAVFLGVQVYASIILPDLYLRNLVLNSAALFFIMQCAWVLLSGLKTENRRVVFLPVSALILVGIVSLARIVASIIVSSTNNNFFNSSFSDMLLFTLQQLAIMFLTFSLIFLVNGRLIFALRRSEEETRSSEEKFSKAFLSNPQSVSITSLRTGCFLDVSDSFLTTIGYSREEVIGHSGREFALWPDENQRKKVYDTFLKIGEVLGVEIPFRTKAGEIHTWMLSAEKFETGGEPCAIWMSVDITERIAAAKALEESQAFNTLLRDYSPNPIAVVDSSGVVKYVNLAFEKLTGYTMQECVGLKRPFPWWQASESSNYVLESETPFSNKVTERTYVKKNGEELQIELHVSTLTKNGEVLYRIGNWVDITARKKAENDLKRRNEYIQTLLDDLPVGVAVIKSGGEIIYYNSAYQKIIDWPADQLTCVDNVFKLIYPDAEYRDHVLGRVMADIRAGGSEPRRWDGLHMVTSRGEKKTISVENFVIPGQDNMVSTVQDTTQKMQVMASLEESEERFRTTLDNLFEGGQIIGFDWSYLYLNKMALRQARKSKHELLGRKITEVYPGIENTPLFKTLQRSMQERISIRVENEFNFADGESGWFDLTIQPVKEGIFVLSLDITDRKIAEDALKQSEENYHSLFSKMTEAFALHEIILDEKGQPVDYRFLEINQAFESMTGLQFEQVIDKTAREVLPGLENQWIQRYGEVALTGQEAYFEDYNHNLDRWFRIYSYSPKKYYFVAQFVDITEQKKAQAAIEESEEKYRGLFENMAQGVTYQNAVGEVISMNAAAKKILNVEQIQLRSTQAIDANIKAVHEDGTEFLASDHPSMQALRTGKPVENVIMGIHNSLTNNCKWIKVSAIPRFHQGQPRPYQVVVTFEDVTSIKQAELILRQSEEVFRYNFDQSPIGAAIVSPDFHFMRVNEEFSRMSEYTPQELTLMSFKDLTHPDDVGKDVRMLQELTEGKIPVYNADKRYITKSGKIIWANISVNVVKDNSGKVLYYMPRIVDISERKLIEEKLKEANQVFSIVANTSPALVWMAGTDKLCTWFNETWLKFTGRSLEQEIGNGWAAGVHPDDLERCLETYTTSFDKRQPFIMEYRLRRYDGEYRWIMDPGIPRYDFKGNFVGYIGSCLDITERKQTESKMLEMETLKQLNRAKSELLANVSHELRTPLASIKGFVETLIEPDVKWSRKQQLEFLQSANVEVDRLTFLIKDLLDMSRLDSGKMALDKRSWTVQEVLDSSKNVATSLAETHKLLYSLAGDLPIISADKSRLGQVITNLVENAVKFSAEGSIIIIGVKKAEGAVIFSVEDHGEGMSEEVRNNLFNRFYQAERVVSGKTRGTGLGLAICKGIVEAHGGTIWVESQVGQGSKFSFSIPFNS
jgi:PAS domain S-box-containing protein